MLLAHAAVERLEPVRKVGGAAARGPHLERVGNLGKKVSGRDKGGVLYRVHRSQKEGREPFENETPL